MIPEKPKNAIDISPAVTITIGIPCQDSGMSLYSIFSRIPAGCGDCSACGNSCCSSKSFFDMSVDNKKEETKAASEEKAENK